MSALQVAILRGQDRCALSIIDATLNPDDLNVTFGGGNTALHLATFLGARDIVERLLERGADASIQVRSACASAGLTPSEQQGIPPDRCCRRRRDARTFRINNLIIYFFRSNIDFNSNFTRVSLAKN